MKKLLRFVIIMLFCSTLFLHFPPVGHCDEPTVNQIRSYAINGTLSFSSTFDMSNLIAAAGTGQTVYCRAVPYDGFAPLEPNDLRIVAIRDGSVVTAAYLSGSAWSFVMPEGGVNVYATFRDSGRAITFVVSPSNAAVSLGIAGLGSTLIQNTATYTLSAGSAIIINSATDDYDIADLNCAHGSIRGNQYIVPASDDTVNITLSRGIPIDRDHFPDDAFRAFVANSYDTNKDGYLNSSEISEAERLIYRDSNVRSLQGIEYLTALNYIDLHETSITELDLSNNTALQTVHGSWNEQLVSVTLGKNSVLSLLHFPNSPIPLLDISGCPLIVDAYLNGTDQYSHYYISDKGDLYVNEITQIVTDHFVASGICGENLIWSLDDSGVLTISGTGYMGSWYVYTPVASQHISAPWRTNRASIKKIILEPGVKSIGRAAFQGISVDHIIIPNTVKEIEEAAFYGCSMEWVAIPSSVTRIGYHAFMYTYLTDIYYSGTEEQWNAIGIALEAIDSNVTIHYNSNGAERIIESGPERKYSFLFSPGESIEDIIPDSSFQYDPRLANFLGVMARSAYNYDLMEQNYNILEFDDTPPAQDHFADNDPLAGYYIRRKTLADGSILVLVTFRGSTKLREWLGTNFNLGNGTMLYSHGWHSGFRASAEAAYGGISWLFHDTIPTENVRYVLTGHSLGAAAANLLAIKLYEAGVPSTDVYDYNFACPNVAMGPDGISEWNPNGVHSNIFNIGNRFDMVSYLPGVLCEKISVVNNFFMPVNAKWNKYGVSYWFDNGFQNVKDAHMMEQYLDYLATGQELDKHHVFSEYEASAIFVNNNVNFAVYDNSHMAIFSFFDGSVNYYGHTVGEKVVAFTDGERIIVYIREGIAYDIHYFPKEENKQFDVTFASTNLATGNISSERTFSAVNLAPDRPLVCSVGVDTDAADVKLYVVDLNNNPIGEVNEDGTEIPLYIIRNSPYTKGSNTSIYIEPLKNNSFAGYAVSQSADGNSLTPIQASGFTTITTTSEDGSSVLQYSMILGHELLDTFSAGTYYLWGIGNDGSKTQIGSFVINVADNVIATVNGVECTTIAEINAAVKDVEDPVITVIPGRTIPAEDPNTSWSGPIFIGYAGLGDTGVKGLYIDKDATLDLNGGTVCGCTVYAANLMIVDSMNGEGKVTQPFVLKYKFVIGGGGKNTTITVTGGSFVPEFNVSKYLAPGYTVESKDGWDKVVPVTYTVSFDANGGTNAPANQTKTHGDELTLTDSVPYRDGWYFLGWAESPSAVDPDYPRPGGTFTRDADTVLYAVWTQPDLVLPSAITEIGDEAFTGGAFRFVELPKHAMSIGPRAFADCPKLRYIYICDEVTDIAADAFGDKEMLTIFGVGLPDGKKSAAQVYAEAHGFTFIPVVFRGHVVFVVP